MKHKFLLTLLLCISACWHQLHAQTPPEGFSSVTVSSGWDEAVGLTFTKSGNQLFVWERTGKVWVVENGQKSLLLDIGEEVGTWRDFGLLGFALHPQFETNGYFYVLYTVDRHHLLNYGTSSYSPVANDFFEATIGRLTRYTATKNPAGSYAVTTASRKILIGATKETGIPSLHTSHGVGSLVFGTDGTLLVSTGDGASFEEEDAGSASSSYYQQALADGIITTQQNVGAFRAQQLESYNGKILRIDPETGNGVASNPYYEAASPGSVRSKVWALGLRNPFRVTLKPGSGSSNPADAKPGVLYIGDVGYNTWEEINIATKPGMNFGWPLFEGLTTQNLYWAKSTYNYYAPNPENGRNGCSQPYFYFQDLLKQETPTGRAIFTNPCAPSQAIPAAITTFVHSRSAIDWQHQDGGPSRTGTFSGETATVTTIGTPGSPVAGPQFGGSAAMGGVFYTHADFPAEYRNTCFFGDYPSGWIRSLGVDGNDKPVAVRNFVDEGAVVVAMATHPTEGGLYYVNFYPSEIRKVVYNAPANRAPVALVYADKTSGPGPLTIQFDGSGSYDPDGQPLSYLWNFGDGTTSTLVRPAHTFPPGSPTKYTVTLTVTDNRSSGQASLAISANNTPPQVTITSPAENTKYPITGQTIYKLQAAVTDQEHSSSQLAYQWQTILHHDDHEHPEPIDYSPETTTTISPLGCGSESYYYRIILTVTDAAGLATTKEVKLYPDCTPVVNQPPLAAAGEDKSVRLPVAAVTLAGSGSDPEDGSKVSYTWSQISGPTAVVFGSPAQAITGVSNLLAGLYTFRLLVTDSQGAAAGDDMVLTVNPAENVAPTVHIQPVDNLTLPTNSVTLHGTGTDADGTISSYRWTQLSGTSATVSGEATPALSLSDLVAGTYSFRLTVVDNAGATAHDDVSLLVNAAPYVNELPIAIAGADVALTLPTNRVTLHGTGTDTDGTISGYHWTQLSGPFAILSGENTQDLSLSDLVVGNYTLRLMVTDNKGSSAFDEVSVTVNPAATTPVQVPAPTIPQIVSFVLIDGTTNQELGAIPNGAEINLAAFPTTSFNIKAVTNSTVGRVEFSVTGAQTFDNADRDAPYQAFQQNSGKKGGWLPPTGTYTLVATPYEKKGGGLAGPVQTIRFAVSTSTTSKTAKKNAALRVDDAVLADAQQPLEVSCYPNPFITQLTVQVQGKSSAKLPLRLVDMLGREVLSLEDLPAESALSLGQQLSTGVYTLVIGTGVSAKRYKVIKAQ
jgi:glucose/arabinose dehydrogenase